MLLLYLCWIGSFLVVRSYFVPEGFGAYGHYRPAAVDEVALRPPVYAGKAACLECHDEVSQDRVQNTHAGLSCEACHGALADHAADMDIKPVRPTRENSLCLGCHLAGTARPEWFKQIKPAEHFEGDCIDCHEAHSP
jgi:hypothetical protein